MPGGAERIATATFSALLQKTAAATISQKKRPKLKNWLPAFSAGSLKSALENPKKGTRSNNRYRYSLSDFFTNRIHKRKKFPYLHVFMNKFNWASVLLRVYSIFLYLTSWKINIMKQIKRLMLALLLCGSSTTFASPVTVDAGWYGFCFGGVGSEATAGCQNQGIGVAGNTLTFTAAGPAVLKVTDAFNPGDIFNVFVNSVLAFTTSTPGTGAGSSDPDTTFGSGYFSAGSVLLAAGSYNVDIFVSASPFGAGGAYVEVELAKSQVPEPGSLALLGLGLVGLVASRRRKTT